MSEQDFKFYMPVDISKADGKTDDDADSWQIQGIASTDDMDYQGEIVDQMGLDLSDLKAGKGLFNDNHSNVITDILGQIEDADLVDHNGRKALFVKGYLFKHQVKAQAYYNVMKSLKKGAVHRVHYSIEGKILARDKDDVSKIKKAKITKIALTMNPVNAQTFSELCKSLTAFDAEAVEAPLEKTMEAGAPTGAPTAREGGSVLTKESLDSNVKNVGLAKLKKTKKVTDQMIKSNIATLVASNPSVDPLEIARLVCESYEHKLRELKYV